MDRGEYGAAIIEDPQGRAVGSVRFRVDPEDGLYFFRLGVVPEARGQGVARALLCWLEARARDAACGRIWCQVRLGVARNVRLYRTSGFRLCQQHVVLRHHESVVTGTMEKHLSAGTTQPPPPLQSRRATVSLPPTKEIAR
jgi:GNAT superfamily N-acetyltransferase